MLLKTYQFNIHLYVQYCHILFLITFSCYKHCIYHIFHKRKAPFIKIDWYYSYNFECFFFFNFKYLENGIQFHRARNLEYQENNKHLFLVIISCLLETGFSSLRKEIIKKNSSIFKKFIRWVFFSLFLSIICYYAIKFALEIIILLKFVIFGYITTSMIFFLLYFL